MVADGMGGHASGAVASVAALFAVRQSLQRSKLLAAQSVQSEADATLAWRDPDATGSDPNLPAVSVLTDAIKFANTEVYA